jgi:hypothetical protein
MGVMGVTKYYEYGRYDPANLGLVRRVPVNDATVKGGKINLSSLKKPLSSISRIAGQHGRIQGVYLEVENRYQAMLSHAELRKMQNSNATRKPYSIVTNSCIHFVKEMTKTAGIDNPWMVDPRPTSYIGEFREDFPDLDYRGGVLTIEGVGVF